MALRCVPGPTSAATADRLPKLRCRRRARKPEKVHVFGEACAARAPHHAFRQHIAIIAAQEQERMPRPASGGISARECWFRHSGWRSSTAASIVDSPLILAIAAVAVPNGPSTARPREASVASRSSASARRPRRRGCAHLRARTAPAPQGFRGSPLGIDLIVPPQAEDDPHAILCKHLLHRAVPFVLHLSPQQLGPEALIAVIRHDWPPDSAQRRTSPVSPATSSTPQITSIFPSGTDSAPCLTALVASSWIIMPMVRPPSAGAGSRCHPARSLACMSSVCGSSSVAISSAGPISPQRSRATRLCERPSALIRPRNPPRCGGGGDRPRLLAIKRTTASVLRTRCFSSASRVCSRSSGLVRLREVDEGDQHPSLKCAIAAIGQDAHQVVGGAVARADRPLDRSPRSSTMPDPAEARRCRGD